MHSCCIIIVIVLGRRARPYNGRNVPSPKYPSESLLFWICGKCVHASRVHDGCKSVKMKRKNFHCEWEWYTSFDSAAPTDEMIIMRANVSYVVPMVRKCVRMHESVCAQDSVRDYMYTFAAPVSVIHSTLVLDSAARFLFSSAYVYIFFPSLSSVFGKFSSKFFLWLHVCRIQFIPEQFCVYELLSWAAALLAKHTNRRC